MCCCSSLTRLSASSAMAPSSSTASPSSSGSSSSSSSSSLRGGENARSVSCRAHARQARARTDTHSEAAIDSSSSSDMALCGQLLCLHTPTEFRTRTRHTETAAAWRQRPRCLKMSATIHPVLDATGSDSEPSPQAKRNPAAQPGADDAALVVGSSLCADVRSLARLVRPGPI